jgi:hypothetical protein
MFKRLAHLGINVTVLAISIAVFVAAFLFLRLVGAAGTPPQVSLLAAARSLDIGDVIAPADLAEITAYQDASTGLYFTAEESAQVAGSIMTLPVKAGQPLLKSAVISPADGTTRLAAALADYPAGSLFPLSLDAANVAAPELTSFLPGDLVGITVVFANRPQNSLDANAAYNFQPALLPTPTPSPQEAAMQAQEERSQPPMSKDLFPGGVRVIAVQGLPETPVKDTNTGSAQDAYLAPSNYSAARQVLVLLVPRDSREVLSLALSQADLIVVSLLARGEETASPGFTYWDFEDWFKHDRLEAIQSAVAATPIPTPQP